MAANSTLDVTVIPSKQFSLTGDEVTNPKLNLLGTPTVQVSGNLAQLLNVSASAPSDGHPLVFSTGSGLWGPGFVNVAYLGSGSPSATNFLRGDGTWASPATTTVADKLYMNKHLY